MDWIRSINGTLNYIETHIRDELDVSLLARRISFSPYYLQKIFALMTNMTLSEYIRQRRLSEAGQALQSGNAKVIDIALEYGYETPESFQKAFKRFHGVSPSMVSREGAHLRYLNPLHIQISLTGGKIMDYCVEKMDEMTILGMERRFTYDDSFAEIPKFWTEYYAKGFNRAVPGYLGVCYDDCAKASVDFAYLIASFCDPAAPVPDGYVKRHIPARTWAKFCCVGPMPEALQKVNRQIFTEWLPGNSEYDLAEGMNIEMYTEGDMSAADYVSEIWIPVVKK